jgi:protein-S-isoprenylcysteine O-methyltransferase Ste14
VTPEVIELLTSTASPRDHEGKIMSAPQPTIRQSIYDLREPSRPQRAVLAVVNAACVAIAWWLLIGGGIKTVGIWSGHIWHPGNSIRRLLLGVALAIYFVRLLFTQFVFLKRAIGWSEAVTVAIWMACIYLLLSVAGGTNPSPIGPADALGIALFVWGSWMNSWAEYARHLWKQQPENRGRLYTAGLFRLCRHPNYIGDLLSFSGLALIAGHWITSIIPTIMLFGFVFVNIPMLDAHLAGHYGEDFAAYARRTRRLIPFVY